MKNCYCQANTTRTSLCQHITARRHRASPSHLHLAQTSEVSLCGTSELTFSPEILPMLTCRPQLTVHLMTLEEPCQTFLRMRMSVSEANQSLMAREQLGQFALVSTMSIQYILQSTSNGNWQTNRQVLTLKAKKPTPTLHKLQHTH